MEYVWKSIKAVISAIFIRHPDKSGCGMSSGRLFIGIPERLALLGGGYNNFSALVIILCSDEYR